MVCLCPATLNIYLCWSQVKSRLVGSSILAHASCFLTSRFKCPIRNTDHVNQNLLKARWIFTMFLPDIIGLIKHNDTTFARSAMKDYARITIWSQHVIHHIKHYHVIVLENNLNLVEDKMFINPQHGETITYEIKPWN